MIKFVVVLRDSSTIEVEAENFHYDLDLGIVRFVSKGENIAIFVLSGISGFFMKEGEQND